MANGLDTVPGNDQKLKKIAISGGAPVTLCDVSDLVGASWDADDTIVYGQYRSSGIMRVSANGGTPESLLKQKSRSLSPFLKFCRMGNPCCYTTDP